MKNKQVIRQNQKTKLLKRKLRTKAKIKAHNKVLAYRQHRSNVIVAMLKKAQNEYKKQETDSVTNETQPT